jgi:hypothetical protein
LDIKEVQGVSRSIEQTRPGGKGRQRAFSFVMSELVVVAEQLRLALLGERMKQIGAHNYSSKSDNVVVVIGEKRRAQMSRRVPIPQRVATDVRRADSYFD